MSYEIRCMYCGGRSVVCSWCHKMHKERSEPPPPIDYTQVKPEIEVTGYNMLRLTYRSPPWRGHLRLATLFGREL